MAGLLAAGVLAVPLAAPARAATSGKVVVIVLENEEYGAIFGSASAPYLNALAAQGLLFTDYHAQLHGSGPNYRAMTAGITTTPATPPDNIFRALDQTSHSWTELEESMTGNCGVTDNAKVPGSSDHLYTVAHDPARDWRGNESCATNAVPLTSNAQLTALREFTYIVPNQCDDMHTNPKTSPCPAYFGPVTGGDTVKIADNWLAHVVPLLLSDPAATVIVTFDEGRDVSAQHIFTVELGAGVTPGTVDGQYRDHYGLLSGLYRYYGLGTAPNAGASAAPLPIPDPTPQLEVGVDGPGSVTSSPSGITCGSGQPGPCSTSFTSGAQVTLTATPDTGEVFDGWGGDCSGTGGCEVSMDDARSVTATFGDRFTLTLDPPSGGSIASDVGGIDCPGTCVHDFVSGTAVTLTPHPPAGYAFDAWGGDCLGVQTVTCTLTMDAAKTASVTFAAVPQDTLTVSTGGTDQGSVTSDVGGIACPGVCAALLDHGSAAVLTAHVGANSVFTGWSGACTGTVTTCNVTMNGAQSAAATFDTAPPVTTLDDNNVAVTYNGWTGVIDAGANGGSYRVSNVVSDKATWKSASTTSVTWVAHVGPDGGKANLAIDGTSKGTVDLYAATPGTLSNVYAGLTSKVHSVVVKVLSGKNVASTGRKVSIDAFDAGNGFVSESDPAITYDTWVGTASNHALGGSYRSATANTATVMVTFSGTAIDWIAGKGPNLGKAAVKIDGISMGTVDLYKAAVAWQSVFTYAGLSAGPHTLVIQVLGQKAAASTGTKVLVDGFKIHG